MRTTIIPAQVTTVEDMIAGHLSLSQALLLSAALLGGSALFVMLPPFVAYAGYKIGLIGCVVGAGSLLALRYNGKLLLAWVVILTRYLFRPTYYVFDKNSLHGRQHKSAQQVPAPATVTQRARRATASARHEVTLSDADWPAGIQIITDKKGGLHVHRAKIPRQSLGPAAD